MTEIAEAVAAVPMLDRGPSFVTPLFIRRPLNHFWIQDIGSKDAVRGFLQVDPKIRGCLPVGSVVTSEVGASAIYGLRDNAGSIKLGCRKELASIAHQIFVASPDRPHLRRSIAGFTGDKALLAAARRGVSEPSTPPSMLLDARRRINFHEREFQQVVNALGEGRSVLLSGAPGSGKTTLLHRIEEHLRNFGRRQDIVVRVNAGYRPVIAALASAIFARMPAKMRKMFTTTEDPSAFWSALSGLAREGTNFGATPEKIAEGILHLFCDHLIRQGQRLTLLVDDGAVSEILGKREQRQWRDMMQLLSRAPTTFLVAARGFGSSERDVYGPAEEIRLGGLSRDEIHRAISMLEPTRSQTKALRDVRALSDGLDQVSPLMLNMLASLAVSTAVSAVGSPHLSTHAFLAHATTLLVDGALARLTPTARRAARDLLIALANSEDGTASLASVISQVTAGASETDQSQAADTVARLAHSGLVSLDDRGFVQFSHRSIQEALKRQLDDSEN